MRSATKKQVVVVLVCAKCFAENGCNVFAQHSDARRCFNCRRPLPKVFGVVSHSVELLQISINQQLVFSGRPEDVPRWIDLLALGY